jgi:hypothetical protein
MRVLVCGGRKYDDYRRVFQVLDEHHRNNEITTIIHGGAEGADAHAAQWAFHYDIPSWRFPAKWSQHGKAAGPIRNKQMLAIGLPNLVIAFPGGRGTADMKAQASGHRVPVVEVQ